MSRTDALSNFLLAKTLRRPCRGVAVLLAGLLLSAPAVKASPMDIQRVVSPGGIEAWLVENHDVPLIAMQFGFTGGSVQDPEGKAGLSNLLSGMLDEGAGDLDATGFQERKEAAGVRLSFDSHRDAFTGSLQTLSANSDEGFDLLRLALQEPRFDPDAVERVRAQVLASLQFDHNDPSKVANEAWFRLAFPNHPYGRPSKGSLDSVAAIGRDDLADMARRTFARDTLKVAVVGDIDAKRLGEALDRVFGGLPAKANLKPVAEAEPPLGPQRQVIEMNVPQSVAQFGHRGLKRKDPDFMASFVLNYIIGGGGFSSRLMEEVREKRGLAYSVYSYLSPLKHAATYIGNVATENKSVGQSLDVIRSELRRMAEEGPSEEDLADAKRYLTGSYALRFDTSSKIAGQLLWVQIEDLGIDYVNRRNDLVEAVTLEDVRRVADTHLHADALIVTIVGNPDQLEDKAG